MTVKTTKQEEFMAAFTPINDNLWRFCLTLTRNREDAKELMSETVAYAYDGFTRVNSKTAFLSYMFTIAKRTFFKNKEKYKRMDYYEPNKFDLYESYNLSAETKMEIADLYSALDELPFEIREAIILFDIMGYGREEIATIQDTNLENVKSRLYRGRKKLALILNSDLKHRNSDYEKVK